jgi:hypothetical protein
MSTKAGEYLRHDPIKLRFTTTHSNGSAKSVLKRSLNPSISEIMQPNYVSPATTTILYEKLDVSIVELETKRSLKVTWTGVHNKEESTHSFLLPKTSSVFELADHIAKLVALTPNGTGKIRVFEVSRDGKVQKEFTASEMIGNIPDPVELYAEVRSPVPGERTRDVMTDRDVRFLCRRSRGRKPRRTRTTRSLACSTFPRTSPGRTASPSNSSSNRYVIPRRSPFRCAWLIRVAGREVLGDEEAPASAHGRLRQRLCQVPLRAHPGGDVQAAVVHRRW